MEGEVPRVEVIDGAPGPHKLPPEEEHEEQTLETEADGFFSHKFDYSRNFAETTAVFGAASCKLYPPAPPPPCQL